MTATIRALVPSDAERYVALRREALLAEPRAFSSGPGDDIASSVEHVRRSLAEPGQATFGAFASDGGATPELVGIVRIHRERHQKRAHRSMVTGLYLRSSHRGRGVGRALMDAALGFARSLPGVEYVDLGVGDFNAAALGLYRALGFETWGTEQDSLRADDTVVAEHHMVLRLRR